MKLESYSFQPFFFFWCSTEKIEKHSSARHVGGQPERCPGGTDKKPRLEERPSAPIHLRPVTLALRAPEGTLRRRHYTLLLHGVYYIAKRSVLHTWKWCFTTGQLWQRSEPTIIAIPVVEFQASQSSSFKPSTYFIPLGRSSQHKK